MRGMRAIGTQQVKLGMLLNILECIGQPPETKNNPAQMSIVLQLRNPTACISASECLEVLPFFPGLELVNAWKINMGIISQFILFYFLLLFF